MSDDVQRRVPGQPEPADGTEILTNTDAAPMDRTVVVDEPDRTVLLTADETIVIEKQDEIRINPSNRPQKVYRGMWGPAEIGVVGAGMLALVASILLYVFVLVPSNNELEQDRVERERLEAELLAANAKYGDITNTEAHVAKLVASIDDFESRFLPFPNNGKTALYQRLNGLIAGYGLVNTTGPDYSPLEIADISRPGGNNNETGRAKFRSLFPGVYVTVTLEGPYQNLRRFIREIETSNEFVIISSVELEPSSTQDGGTAPPPQDAQPAQTAPQGISGITMPVQTQQPRSTSAQRGVVHGQVISLRLEMAAYFRRPGMDAVPTDAAREAQQ